jgi:hypothetical protein
MPEQLFQQPATTEPSTQPAELPIGTDSEGGRFFDGKTELRRIDANGHAVVWTLPESAVGSWSEPRLFEADGRLFLFNEAGRVLRLRRTQDADEPFAIDATFTNNIPNTDDPQRVWLDPAGRIVIAHDGSRLSILFPSGRIPHAIAQRMLASDLRANEPE